MPSRREFIQSGLAASALAAHPLTARGGEPYRPVIVVVVVDQTSPQGPVFAAEAANRGTAAYAMGRDPGSVWMNQIEPRWKRDPAVVAGLTSRASLFCLELLARDYGMGLVYRVEHGIRHVITGPESLSEWERRLTVAGKRWGAVAAAMAMNCPQTLEPRIGLLDLVPETSLHSWVFAPARRSSVLGGKRG